MESVEEQEIRLAVSDLIEDRSDDIETVGDLKWYFEEKQQYICLDEWQWDQVWDRLVSHFGFDN